MPEKTRVRKRGKNGRKSGGLPQGRGKKAVQGAKPKAAVRTGLKLGEEKAYMVEDWKVTVHRGLFGVYTLQETFRRVGGERWDLFVRREAPREKWRWVVYRGEGKYHAQGEERSAAQAKVRVLKVLEALTGALS